MDRETGKGPTGLQDEINRLIRCGIRNGTYPPGTRLPSRAVLQKRFRTTPVTIQRAFDKMTEDGFIRSEGRRGTFVADNPPCLFNYAIVFPLQFSESHPEINFWRVLALEAERKSRGSCYSFELYTGLNGHIDEPDYSRLQEDLRADRFAGIIFASSPHLLYRTALFKEIMANEDLPKVAFMTESPFPEIPVAYPDDSGSLERVFDFLETEGIERLAIVTAVSGEGYSGQIPHESLIMKESQKRKIAIEPFHVQVMHTSLAPRARQLTQLLLQGPKELRPQALWIMDDSLVEAVTKGVADTGLRPPGDLLVIGMCNFPERPVSAVPITRYGMNVTAFLDICLQVMEKQHNRLPVVGKTGVPVEFSQSE